MAGKRQHYLPRLLQRGFLAETSDEAERTWLHRRDTTARLVGISDIGVSPWFYSRKSTDGSPTLDDAITEYERDLGRQVRKLREAPPRAPIDASLAAETVIHLTMYGEPWRETVESIPRDAPTVVVVGGTKVPGELFRIADHNVSIGNQPHSEVAALAVFLESWIGSIDESIRFAGGEIEVVPSERAKRVRNSVEE